MRRTVEVALAIPVENDRVLVARRATGVHLGGAWEFPGGKLGAGEDPAAAARRELREETGLAAERLEPLLVTDHAYPDVALRFHVFTARELSGELRIDESREHAWLSPAELVRLEMPEANRPIVSALVERVGAGR